MLFKKRLSRRAQSELVARVVTARGRKRSLSPLIISAAAETGPVFPVTRHFVPGYLHLVPSGQKLALAPVHVFDSITVETPSVNRARARLIAGLGWC
jgi:hypothetical protein